MKLKLLRLTIFDRLLGPFQAGSRNKRMRSYVALMDVKEGTSVLDLGGQPMIWDSVPFQINLTILNLPGIAVANHISNHRIEYVTGDACNVERYLDGTFDTVFSNSVIEHVGSCVKQGEFAREVRRLGKSYWVQTPSKWFPIEAHCGMPFWWFYPKILRRHLVERWRKTLPA